MLFFGIHIHCQNLHIDLIDADQYFKRLFYEIFIRNK